MRAARPRARASGGIRIVWFPQGHIRRRAALRSVVITGHKTSITLEDEFWKGLREIAHERDMTPSELVAAIDADRQSANLSSAIRLFVLRYYRDQVVDQVAEGSAPETLDAANTPGQRLVICSMRFRTEKSSILGPLG